MRRAQASGSPDLDQPVEGDVTFDVVKDTRNGGAKAVNIKPGRGSLGAGLILHRLEHLFHVVNAKLFLARTLIFTKRVKLT